MKNRQNSEPHKLERGRKINFVVDVDRYLYESKKEKCIKGEMRRNKNRNRLFQSNRSKTTNPESSEEQFNHRFRNRPGIDSLPGSRERRRRNQRNTGSQQGSCKLPNRGHMWLRGERHEQGRIYRWEPRGAACPRVAWCEPAGRWPGVSGAGRSRARTQGVAQGSGSNLVPLRSPRPANPPP